MSKAEDFAIKKYPVSIKDIYGHKVDVNLWQRKACVEGYQQAEKDLELTWEDIADILGVTDVIAMEEHLITMSEEEYCQEVLKRFKGKKEK